jgi:hypothetical protein
MRWISPRNDGTPFHRGPGWACLTLLIACRTASPPTPWEEFSPVATAAAGGTTLVQAGNRRNGDDRIREVVGLARFDGVWHVGLMGRRGGVSVVPAAGGSDPPVLVVPTDDRSAMLVPAEPGLPWVVYRQGAGVHAWRVGQADATSLGAPLKPMLSLDLHAWIPRQGGGEGPRGLIGLIVEGKSWGARERTLSVVETGPTGREGVPRHVTTYAPVVRDFQLLRSEADIAVVWTEKVGEEQFELHVWRNGVDVDEGRTSERVQSLLTADGRLFVAELHGRDGAGVVTVRRIGGGARRLPVDGRTGTGDVALLECGGTVWALVANPGAESDRLELYDLGADRPPIDLPGERSGPDHDSVGALVVACGGNEAAVADMFATRRGHSVRVRTWRWQNAVP